jgi:hypothetical protein
MVVGCLVVFFLAGGESETCPERVEREKANEMVMRGGRKERRKGRLKGMRSRGLNKCGKVTEEDSSEKKRKGHKLKRKGGSTGRRKKAISAVRMLLIH